MEDESEEARRSRSTARLEIVEALLWALEHADEVIAITRGSASRGEALEVLTSPPHQFSPYAAHHILDMTFRSLSEQSVAQMKAEAERLRRGEDTAPR